MQGRLERGCKAFGRNTSAFEWIDFNAGDSRVKHAYMYVYVKETLERAFKSPQCIPNGGTKGETDKRSDGETSTRATVG